MGLQINLLCSCVSTVKTLGITQRAQIITRHVCIVFASHEVEVGDTLLDNFEELLKTYVRRVGESISRRVESTSRVRESSRRVARIARVQNPYRVFPYFHTLFICLSFGHPESASPRVGESRKFFKINFFKFLKFLNFWIFLLDSWTCRLVDSSTRGHADSWTCQLV